MWSSLPDQHVLDSLYVIFNVYKFLREFDLDLVRCFMGTDHPIIGFDPNMIFEF